MATLWRTIRALSSRSGRLRTNFSNYPTNPELIKFKDDLIQEDVLPGEIPYLEVPPPQSPEATIPFTKNEFNAALNSCKPDAAPGLDGVTGEMIKRLDPISREFLQILFNRMLFLSTFPEAWTRTRVLPIPEPGGKSFRPIALTSILSKIFEKLV